MIRGLPLFGAVGGPHVPVVPQPGTVQALLRMGSRVPQRPGDPMRRARRAVPGACGRFAAALT